MMKLSTMRTLIMTLDENGESPIANVIASRWNHDLGTVRFFRASANFLFLFKHSGQDYVLRFISVNERAFDAIHAELAYIDHLAVQGAHVAKPVLSRVDNLVETIETDLGMFHAVVFERLMGEQLELPDLTPGMITRWGQPWADCITQRRVMMALGVPRGRINSNGRPRSCRKENRLRRHYWVKYKNSYLNCPSTTPTLD